MNTKAIVNLLGTAACAALLLGGCSDDESDDTGDGMPLPGDMATPMPTPEVSDEPLAQI